MSAEEIRAQSYVGFDSITQQIEHKLLKRGFQFNVIVVGELFLFYNSKDVGAESTRPEQCLVISFPVRAIFSIQQSSHCIFRTDWLGEIDPHQHNFCLTPD